MGKAKIYIFDPDTPKQQMAASKRASSELSQETGYRMVTSSFSGHPSNDEGISTIGGSLTDDFKHFIEMHPDISFEEAKRKYKEMIKGKQRSRGPN